MQTKLLVLALSIILITASKSHAQDPGFTQWENSPMYLNPALTGNFDGLLRLRVQHRDQWRSILKDDAYRTSAISADYKFSNANARKISVGAFLLRDKAGSLDFTNNGFHITSSVVQPLGDPDQAHHSIALGFNVGWTTRSIDWEKAQWPGGGTPTDLNDKTSYPDISAGLLWQYQSNTHFAYQLGSALLHINKPNVSFSDTSVDKLYNRFNLHGYVEIPLFQSFSMIPSFFYNSQGPSEQLDFGLNNRWYPKSSGPNFVQLGVFAKTNRGYTGETDINVYVVSLSAEINSFLVGFSFDRFEGIESNAYEFSIGYRFGKIVNREP